MVDASPKTRPEHNEDMELALHKVGDVIVIDQVEGDTNEMHKKRGSDLYESFSHQTAPASGCEERIHLAHVRLAAAAKGVRQSTEELDVAEKELIEAKGKVAEALAAAAVAESRVKQAHDALASAQRALESEYEKVERLGESTQEEVVSNEVPSALGGGQEDDVEEIGRHVNLPQLHSAGKSSQHNELVLYSKFLGHTIKNQPQPPPPSPVSSSDGSEAAPPSESSVPTTTSPETVGGECTWLTDPQKTFRQVGVWKIADVRMVLGSDLLILGNQKHPKIALYLQDLDESKGDSKGKLSKRHLLNYWLENAMAGIPEIAICFHSKGVVQYYELYKTHEILELCGIDATDALTSTLKVLQWLKASITKEGATYWLTKPKNQGRLELFDLSSSLDGESTHQVSSLDPAQGFAEAEEMPCMGHPLRASLPINPFRHHVGLIYYHSAATLLACATRSSSGDAAGVSSTAVEGVNMGQETVMKQLHQARRCFKLGIDIMRQTKHACEEKTPAEEDTSCSSHGGGDAHLHRSDLLIYVARLGVAHTHLLERTAVGATLPCSLEGCAALSQPPFQMPKITAKPVFSLTGFPVLHFVCPALVLPNSVKDKKPTFLEEKPGKPLFNILLASLKLLVDLLKECSSEESLTPSRESGDTKEVPNRCCDATSVDANVQNTADGSDSGAAPFKNFVQRFFSIVSQANPKLSTKEVDELLTKKWESLLPAERESFKSEIEDFKLERFGSAKLKTLAKQKCNSDENETKVHTLDANASDYLEGKSTEPAEISKTTDDDYSFADKSKIADSEMNQDSFDISSQPLQPRISAISNWSHMAHNALYYVRQQVTCSVAYVLFLLAELLFENCQLGRALEVLSLSQTTASKCENPSIKMASHMFRGQEFVCAVHNLAGDIFACLAAEDWCCPDESKASTNNPSDKDLESLSWVLKSTEAVVSLIPSPNLSQAEVEFHFMDISVAKSVIEKGQGPSGSVHPLLASAQTEYEAAVRVLPLDMKASPVCHYLLSKVASCQNQLGMVLGNRCGSLGGANRRFLRSRAIYSALEMSAPAALCAANAGTTRALAAEVGVILLTQPSTDTSDHTDLAKLMEDLCTEEDAEACSKAQEKGGLHLANLTFLARLGDTALQYIAMAGKLIDKKVDTEAAHWMEYLFSAALSLSSHRLGLCPPPSATVRDLLTACSEMSNTALTALKKLRSKEKVLEGVTGPLALAHAHLMAARSTNNLVLQSQKVNENIGSLKKKATMIEAHLDSALTLIPSDDSKPSLILSCLVNMEFAKAKQLQTSLRALEAGIHNLQTACSALVKLVEVWSDDKHDGWSICDVCRSDDKVVKRLLWTRSIDTERWPSDSFDESWVYPFLIFFEKDTIEYGRQALKHMVQESLKKSSDSIDYWKKLYMCSLQSDLTIQSLHDILKTPK